MSLSRLTHFYPAFCGMGGVESVLRHHYERDDTQGTESRFVVYHEAGTEPRPRVSFLDIAPRTTIREARRRLEAAVAQGPPEVAVYHGMWGMPYFADLDRAKRRILMLHGDVPDMDGLVRSRGPWVDGILCVNKPLRQFVGRCLPQLEAERIGVVPYPVFPPFPASARAPLGERPCVLGFCGRLVVEQKRVDRLPALCAHLDQMGLAYRLEFLGEGPERAWLERQFPDRAKFIFHGRQSGEAYWRILTSWDAILFVSDYEGTPIAMLEALSMGVVPIYPRIGSGGDAYAEGLCTDLLYEPGDWEAMASTIRELVRLRPEDLESLRHRCQRAVAHHLGENYLSQFARFVRQIKSGSRVSEDTFPQRPWPLDDLSFTWIARIGAVRRTCLRLLRR
jgi:glycosyltransferase involved in cell wall biosynthesis